ncbi:hypothetical protein PR202_ga17173 [Eleusine coracana subsp. coracana]|uniref:PGG domain-containing protein n=1 Tax=Eleusine coracana subsp. coracana TaxID=191504 RepID=A0AAV5CQ96_ELECO|nr:hypothetical protein PR202_ga17173 [Eleusine coracana subsp. coracana]
MSDHRRQAASPGREDSTEVPVVDSDGDSAAEHKEWLKEMRGWLIVLATLAASVTYQAGLNPPGGFWQDDKDSKHVPGNPVLHDGKFVKRYLTFYYFNATAFATSLVIIILLLNKRFYMSEARVAALTLTTMVDLMSLVGAYIAGSTRDMPNSIYIIVLTCFLFVCVVYMARVLPNLCFIVLFMAPPLFWLANKGWLPVPMRMKQRVERAKKREEEDAKKQSAEDKAKAGKTRCYCCSCGRAFKYDAEVETGHGAA